VVVAKFTQDFAQGGKKNIFLAYNGPIEAL
jgi:hypothetical protein